MYACVPCWLLVHVYAKASQWVRPHNILNFVLNFSPIIILNYLKRDIILMKVVECMCVYHGGC